MASTRAIRIRLLISLVCEKSSSFCTNVGFDFIVILNASSNASEVRISSSDVSAILIKYSKTNSGFDFPNSRMIAVLRAIDSCGDICSRQSEALFATSMSLLLIAFFNSNIARLLSFSSSLEACSRTSKLSFPRSITNFEAFIPLVALGILDCSQFCISLGLVDIPDFLMIISSQ